MIKCILKKETLLLAIITSASYCSAYFFELGYANHFNYSKDLISISIMNLLQMGFGLFMFIFIITGIMDMLVSLINPLGIIGKIAKNLFSYFFLFIIMLMILFLNGNVNFKYLAISIGIFALLVVIVSFPFKEKSKNIFESINNNIEKELVDRKSSVRETRLSTDMLAILFILIIFSLIITSLGKYGARTKSVFYSIEKNNMTYVIVNKYNDYFIAKKINKDKELEDDTYIFNITELNNIPMREIKIVAGD
ncbi:hypothetical protein J6836_06685 [Providencia sp. R33]|uniref:hypothetical protein n=1 Tax=Providencia sp. R33 TaxID=2828763 RepID=UPI001C5ADDAF|nr:hypothetical protein J6836_06615 [Providencia sp. R33]QXX84059.1 hypothetical protein J6836_06685 [Providencia sp. R33]